ARLRLAFRLGLSHRLARGDQATEQVDLVIVVDALEHRGDALQAHPGVDALLRQLGYDLARRLLILHEDEVPDLDEAVAVLVPASRLRGARHGRRISRNRARMGHRRPSTRNCPWSGS